MNTHLARISLICLFPMKHSYFSQTQMVNFIEPISEVKYIVSRDVTSIDFMKLKSNESFSID